MYMRLSFLTALLACLFGAAAQATEIGVVGLFPGKAVLVVDSGSPKTYSVGQNIDEGIKLIAADESTATLDVHGKRQTIAIGQHVSRSAAGSGSKVTLHSDSRGHFMAQGQVNGIGLTMMVDTGASMIAMSSNDATRLGINYKKGQLGSVATANGTAAAYKVKLDSVKIGDIEMTQIDAVVQENGLPFALLGMSFLNRTEMHRDGDLMTLTKRF